MTVTSASSMHTTLKAEEEIVMAVEKMREAQGDPVVRELMEARQKALHDEATWRAESRREGLLEGRQEGRQEGLQEGLQDGLALGEARAREERAEALRKQRETARKLRERGMNTAEILDITGLTEAELEGV
jgi:predicted transposase/invertase (TIGR01784 family)